MAISKSFVLFNNQTYKDDTLYPDSNPRIKIMTNMVDFDQKILDLGCGSGVFIKILNKKNKLVEGVEISQKLAKLGQKNGLKIKIADLHKTFPYGKNSFDTITAGEIIEHIYDTDFFLKEIKRILKPKGFLILSTPNIASFGRRLMLFFGINPLIETSLNNGSCGHIRYFTKKSLQQLLGEHNFKIIKVKSDIVNFSSNGKIKNQLLASIFPKLGSSLIIKAKNIK